MKINKAITLIELLVSIGVLVVTLSLAAMFIKFYQPALELGSAAGELRRVLSRARALALVEQIDHGVTFLPASGSYELVKLESGATVLATYTLPAHVEFYSVGSFTNNTARFNPAGAALEAGAIVIQNGDGKLRQIIVNPSGYVSTP